MFSHESALKLQELLETLHVKQRPGANCRAVTAENP
jgi:hypothetical protein